MNHELDGEEPEGWAPQISHLTLDTRRRVRAGRYELDGTEGFLRFCSSSLAMPGWGALVFTRGGRAAAFSRYVRLVR
jgi:hypothetical protein